MDSVGRLGVRWRTTTRLGFVYMVRCSDDSLYVGIATDIEERIKRHNWGVGPKFTAHRRPVELIWNECCGSSEVARHREKQIKGWSRAKKLALAASGIKTRPS